MLASSLVMNDLWDPLSSSVLASTHLFRLVTLAIAILRRQTLLREDHRVCTSRLNSRLKLKSGLMLNRALQ